MNASRALRVSVATAAACCWLAAQQVLAAGDGATGSVSGSGPDSRADAQRAAQGSVTHQDLDERLEAARSRLEAAAKEVAALSSQMGKTLVDQIMGDNGPGSRALIGVELAAQNAQEGARVMATSPGGAAAEAGIREGDLIVAINGKDVRGAHAEREVARQIRDAAPNSRLQVRVLRDGKPRDFVVIARPSFGFHAYTRALPAPPMSPLSPMGTTRPMGLFAAWGPGALFGPPQEGGLSSMQFATLTPQLGRYFGTEKGVLVVRAAGGTDFKLQEGDVILTIDGREPSSGAHAIRILSSYQPGEKIMLRVMRDHKPLEVAARLPDMNLQPPRVID